MSSVMRDKGILIFILFVPLVYPLLYSYVYTNEVVREVPAAVVDEANSSRSREFIRHFDASPDVSVVAHCGSMAEAEQLLKHQEVYGILHIPSSFERDLWHGDQTTLGLYCDMCSMLYPSTFGMNGYVSITAMGCSLSDISTKCIALALQSIAYFTVYALFFCRKPCR